MNMRTVIFSILVLGFAHAGHANCIDVDTAWQRIMRYAPSLAAADAEISILDGEAEQVSLRPNPIFEVESENLGVSNPSDDVEPPQTTFSVAQLLELRGKRSARFRLASSISTMAYWEAQIRRQDLFFELMRTFIEARAAEEKWRIASERLEISEQILTACKKQIQNGKISPIQEKRARIEMMSEMLALKEAFSEYEQARVRLSSLWGSSCPDFDAIDFDLYVFEPPPCEMEMVECFYQTPDYLRAQQAVYSASQNLALQRVNSIPDVTIMAGFRIFHDTNTGGVVVGAEIPLPFFDRNQGHIKSAHSGVSQAQYELDEVMRQANERISLTHQRLTATYEETEIMYHEIVKEAEETVELTKVGYDKGKFEYLELLEARKMLFDIQEKYLDILCEYHLNRAQLARISGMKL